MEAPGWWRGLACDNSLAEVDMSTCELELQWSELELRQLSIQKSHQVNQSSSINYSNTLFIFLEVGFYIERFPR